jgi:hypothetical protein
MLISSSICIRCGRSQRTRLNSGKTHNKPAGTIEAKQHCHFINNLLSLLLYLVCRIIIPCGPRSLSALACCHSPWFSYLCYVWTLFGHKRLCISARKRRNSADPEHESGVDLTLRLNVTGDGFPPKKRKRCSPCNGCNPGMRTRTTRNPTSATSLVVRSTTRSP